MKIYYTLYWQIVQWDEKDFFMWGIKLKDEEVGCRNYRSEALVWSWFLLVHVTKETIPQLLIQFGVIVLAKIAWYFMSLPSVSDLL